MLRKLKRQVYSTVLEAIRESFLTPLRVSAPAAEVAACRCSLLAAGSLRELLDTQAYQPWSGVEACRFALAYLVMSLRAAEWSSVVLAASQLGMPIEVARALLDGTPIPEPRPEPPQPEARATETQPEEPRPECMSCSPHGELAPHIVTGNGTPILIPGQELWIKNADGSCPHYPNAAKTTEMAR